MLSAYIIYEKSEIHYLRYGTGSDIIICLHGYGESASSFGLLVKHLPESFSLIAIDLPFHGSTKWNESRKFTVTDLVCVIEQIFLSLQLNARQFILLGYSMGGRIALSVLQHIPERITRLVLLAPDGMKVNFWYWLSTQTSIGKRLFRFTMSNPKLFRRILNISAYFRLINKSLLKFVNAYMDNAKIRDDLFHRWICMSDFKPSRKKLYYIIKEKQVPVRLLYGKHDRIIRAKRAQKFNRTLQPLCELHIINAGHQVLHPKYAHTIADLLIDKKTIE